MMVSVLLGLQHRISAAVPQEEKNKTQTIWRGSYLYTLQNYWESIPPDSATELLHNMNLLSSRCCSTRICGGLETQHSSFLEQIGWESYQVENFSTHRVL
jgi:hypothetical protein